MKVYMNTPEEAVAMTLAGVQLTCVGSSATEWPDQIFEHHAHRSEDVILGYYMSNFNSGLRFYIEAE